MNGEERQRRLDTISWLARFGEMLEDFLSEGVVATCEGARRAAEQALLVVKQELFSRAGDISLFEEGSLDRILTVGLMTRGMKSIDVPRVLRQIAAGPR